MRANAKRAGAVAAVALFLGAGSGVGTASAAGQEACWDEARPAQIWPGISFQQAADLDDFRRTMSQNRDQVRQMLEREFSRLLEGLTEAGGDPRSLIEPVLSAVLAFDELHDRHRERASEGVPVFLEVGVRTALDQLYRANRIAPEQRRLRFVNLGLVERLQRLRERMRTERSADDEDLETLRQVAHAVDLIAYGTFSSDGARQRVTITLENVRSGSLCDFEATGSLEQVTYLLAEEVFRTFQAVRYPAIRNPNPNLTWIRPPTDEPIAHPEQAGAYCRSQGEDVRLPYALELTTAAQVGAEGASYVPGGIPRLEPGPWVVADRLREDAQYYYFAPEPGRVDNHPDGPVRTAAGLGALRARYWCVRGEPDPRVVRIDDLYRVYRQVSRADPRAPALDAVAYLLHRERALGAPARRAPAFASAAAARAAIERECGSLGGGAEVATAAAPTACVTAGIRRNRGR